MRRIIYIGVFLLIMSVSLANIGEWAVPSYLEESQLYAVQQSDSERLTELKRLIDNEIGVPYANEPSQCRLIGFGAKPCGGPWGYLLYSTARTNGSTLNRLVGEYNQTQERVNNEGRIGSDCMMAPKPKIEFKDGICTAVDELKRIWEEGQRKRGKS